MGRILKYKLYDTDVRNLLFGNPDEPPPSILKSLVKEGFLLNRTIHREKDIVDQTTVFWQEETLEHIMKRKFGPSPKELQEKKRGILMKDFGKPKPKVSKPDQRIGNIALNSLTVEQKDAIILGYCPFCNEKIEGWEPMFGSLAPEWWQTQREMGIDPATGHKESCPHRTLKIH
jgi:hypothetical protein